MRFILTVLSPLFINVLLKGSFYLSTDAGFFWVWRTMLGEREIERFYMDGPLTVPSQWNLARKHFRIATRQGRFVDRSITVLTGR